MPLPRQIVVLAVAAVAAVTLACSESTGPSLPLVSDIVVSALPDTLAVGDSAALAAVARDASGRTLDGVAIEWRSLTPAIASVSGDRVRGLVAGEARLVARARGRAVVEDTITVPVRHVAASITFAALADTLYRGGTDTARVEVRDAHGVPVPDARVQWSSGDTMVLAVDSTGALRVRDQGTAWLRARSGSVMDSVRVRTDYRGQPTPAIFVGYERSALGSWCGWTAAGEVWCRFLSEATPSLVPGGLPLHDVQVSQTFACGLAMADSTLHCWGSRRWDGNGTRSTPSSTSPVLAAGGRKLLALSIGSESSLCGIHAADSVVYCWGFNDRGQNGRGVGPVDTLVAPVSGSLEARSIDVGFHDACAIALDGKPWCWGQGAATGQDWSTITLPVPIAGTDSYTSVMMADEEGACGLRADGTVDCWSGTLRSRVRSEQPLVRLFGGLRNPPPIRYDTPSVCGLSADGGLHCFVAWNDGFVHPVIPTYQFLATRRFRDVTLHRDGFCALEMSGTRVYCQ